MLLRHVVQADVPIVQEALEQAMALRDVAVSPIYGLLEREAETYVASQYIDGLALDEFLRLASTPRWFGEVLRILHDALIVAERLDARRAAEGLGPSRYLFSDTIWVTLQGKVVISEPVVAAHLLHVAPTSQTFKRPVTPRLARAFASDVEELASLLGKWHAECFASKGGPVETSRTLLGVNVEQASRHDLARLLADLSDQPVASPAQVAAAVQRLAGTELVRRRLLGAQASSAPPLKDEEAVRTTVHASVPRPAPARSREPPPPSPLPASLQGVRQRLGAVGEGPPQMDTRREERTVWGGGTVYDASALDDDDEVTAAFRPSQLPRLLAGGEPDVFDRPTATPPEPQSLPLPEPLEPANLERLARPPLGFEPAPETDAVATAEDCEEQQLVLELKVRRAPAAHEAAPEGASLGAGALVAPLSVAADELYAEASQVAEVPGAEPLPTPADVGRVPPPVEAPLAREALAGASDEALSGEPSAGASDELLAADEPIDAVVEFQRARRQRMHRLIWGTLLVFIFGLALLWALPLIR